MTDNRPICPVCEEGHLSPALHALDVKHGDRTIRVEGLEHSLCDNCGADPVLTDQIRCNQRKIADAKRAADGLLTGAEIVGIRESLAITQQVASVIFGGGANAFSKYERGDVIQSVAMDRLLRATVAFPQMLDFLRARAGLAVAEHSAYSAAFGEVLLPDSPVGGSPGGTLMGPAVVVSTQGYRERRAA